ncbi:MAG: chemotaxis protein CheW [Candidatus Sericytochromatia bacterium]
MSNIIVKIEDYQKEKFSKRNSLLSKKILEDTKDKTEFILFSINENNFALESKYLIEVITEFYLYEYEFLPNFLKGIINIRGKVIFVNDLSYLIFEDKNIQKGEIIRIKYKNIDTGFFINNINKIEYISENNFSLISKNNNKYKFTKKSILINNKLFFLLDLDSLFLDEKLVINDK